jgi:hypothetical protein
MSNRAKWLLLSGIGLFGTVANGGTITPPVQFTTDAGIGIVNVPKYTHVLDFIADGSPATVNGVAFTAAGPSGSASGNLGVGSYGWSSTAFGGQIDEGSGSVGVQGALLNASVPAGSGASKLLADFYYNIAATPGSAESLTLTGLTPGLRYETRVYYRAWANDQRTTLVQFDEGGGGVQSISIDQDLDRTHGSYVAYTYTAGASGSLLMTYSEGFNPPTASWHNYAVTNELAPVPEPGGVVGLAVAGAALTRGRRRRCAR